MACWLFKSEPGCFSIDDLAASPGQTSSWDGVRNYQARNFMKIMKMGDRAFFYNSGKNPEIAGLVEVVREYYPDHTALDPDNDHYDPAATPEKPRWGMVDVKLVEKFPRPVPRAELRMIPALAAMELMQRGSRLSVQPVGDREFDIIMNLVRNEG